MTTQASETLGVMPDAGWARSASGTATTRAQATSTGAMRERRGIMGETLVGFAGRREGVGAWCVAKGWL